MRLENSCLPQEELILLLNRNWNIYAYYMGRNRFLYREYLKTLRYEDYYDSHSKADICRFYEMLKV